MYTRTTTIVNKTGLHARPASEFVECAKHFDCQLTLKKLGTTKTANPKSIIMLLAMGLSCGSEIEIVGDGADEREAVDALAALIESGFGEV